MFEEFTTGAARAAGNDGALREELPIAISPDSVVWTADGAAVDQLAAEYVRQQVDNDAAIFTALDALVQTMADLTAGGDQAPPQVVGHLLQPSGAPAPRVQVSLELTGVTTAEARLASAVTSEDGSFVLPIPTSARTAATLDSTLVVTGGTGVQKVVNALAELQPSGVLPPLRLPQPVEPLPVSVIAALQKVVDEAPGAVVPAEQHSQPALAVGEDECQIVFRKDTSSDRFPYGVLFRLTDPALSQPSLRMSFELPGQQDRRVALNMYGTVSPAAHLAGGIDKLQFHLTQRVPVDRPISIDAFRKGLAAAPNLFGGVPIAGSLAIGYVVTMAQRWTPLGLALGDLVYSLPLAPGEQQRIAVVERSATSTVIESERLDSAEQISFAERDDTSATATFSSAFRETAAGGSHYDTEASSFSVAAAVGGGGVFPFGCVAGGVSTSYGRSSSSGNTDTWMSGARNSTSDAAQSTHSSVQRQAAARRSSSRTAMRLASATESTEIVTKVITNHNKTRALTMQYWEVQRLFDVTTHAEGVNLVCMVPLDVVRFLPFGQPTRLSDAPDTRDEVLNRYAELLGHTDELARVVPGRYRRGLSLISDFAADPTTSVAGSSAPAEDILDLSLSGTFLPFDDLWVTVLGKRGMRVGPTRLTGTSKVTLPTGKDAYTTEEDLLGALRKVRQDVGNPGVVASYTGHITLPAGLPRQDVVGFEISRRTNRLDYHFAPPAIADLNVFGLTGSLTDALAQAVAKSPSYSRSYAADRLERELGGPQVTGFSASLPAAPPNPAIQLASTGFGGGTALPTSAYPIASRTVPPILSYASILEIEKTLQWVMRNTMTCSVAVFASLTPEERAVMLERYEIQLPPDKEGKERPAVPLLSCITNNVLGYYGNSMVLPFIIPAEITEATTEFEGEGEERHVVKAGITTAQIQDALTRFHTDGFDPPRSTIALPTKGVLGEAVLGHCPSAEKIDLTRFWNWQDSPGDAAPEISPISMPTGSLTSGLTAPSALTGLAPIITNFNTSPVAADTSLAAGLIKLAESEKGFDIKALTNADNLGTLTGKTLDTAEAARKDALKSATDLAIKAMETSASIYTGKKDDKKKNDKGGDTPDPGSGGGGGSTDPGGEPPDPPAPQAPKPQSFSVYFELDKTVVADAAKPGQVAALTAIIADAKDKGATGAVVRGYASPEGPPAHNVDLGHNRADAVVAKVTAGGIPATRAEGGVLAGQPGDYPQLRRADIAFTY